MARLRLLAGLAAAAALVVTTSGASATSSTRSVPLPTDFQPEGIAVGPGARFYVGSMNDGDIYRGNLRSGKGHVFIDVSHRQALGMKVDRRRHQLFVAGGFTGHGYVYDTRSGRTLANFTLAKPGTTVVNDVVVTRHAAYFTDSFSPHLYRVPLGGHGRFGTPEAVTVTGPAGGPTPKNKFGLNGIAAAGKGRTLLVDRSDRAALYTIDPSSGHSHRIPLRHGKLVKDTADGILLEGRTLFVVENFANRLVKIRLSPGLTHARVEATVKDRHFKVPTAVGGFDDKLGLVNARFDLGLPPPAGPGAPKGTRFDVVVIPKP